MSTFTILCSSTNHASRSGQPDWMASLGTADRQITGMKCGACARLDPVDPLIVNRDAVMAAIDQAKIDMQAILDTADIPAGTLTSAQLSNFVRTAQTQLKSVALRVKQVARLLDGDFTSSN